jgi:hypothetical protein
VAQLLDTLTLLLLLLVVVMVLLLLHCRLPWPMSACSAPRSAAGAPLQGM